MININRISALEKVLIICLAILIILLLVWFGVGIITSDTLTNPIELIRNIDRFISIVLIIVLSGSICKSYIELNKRRS